jgi:type IV pilus assembly protein PilB
VEAIPINLRNAQTNIAPSIKPVPIPYPPVVGRQTRQALPEQKLVSSQKRVDGNNLQSRLNGKLSGKILPDKKNLIRANFSKVLELKNALEADSKLGAILTAGGIISKEDLETALRKQKNQKGHRLGELLITMGLLDCETLALALALQRGIPYVDLKHYAMDGFHCSALSPELLRRLKVFPIKLRQNELTVVVADPNNLRAEADLRFHTALHVKVAGVSSEKAIMDAIDITYGDLSRNRLDRILDAREEIQIETIEESEEDQGHFISDEEGKDRPTVEIVNHILKTAVSKRASDIHILPVGKIAKVKFRIDGVLYDELSFQKDRLLSITNRLKILSDMDIAERRLPQDGSTKIRVHGKTVDLRFSCLPTVSGQSMVIRLLDNNRGLMKLDEMGFFDEALKGLRKCLSKSFGMILLTGPTGSGKSTTIYSCLQESVFSNRNITTLENPVEYRLPGVCQVQIRENIGLSFARGLRQILRHDPDVIVVGEMRDSETAKTGVRAALTGHLVISTLHTNSAAETFIRLGDMGVDNYLVSSSVLGVVSQRLVRKICPHCKEPDPDAGKKLRSYDFPLKFTEDVVFYRGKGCEKCNDIGYKGRTLVYEFIPTNERIKKAIVDGRSVSEIREAAIQKGVKTIEEIAFMKAKAGTISVDEIIPLLSIA